ncbi:MAG: rhodanese-like domain-containing protein [Asticcacaulis sp.]
MTQDIKNLSPAEVAEALNAGTIHLVDVREPAEFDQVSIEGSISLPLSVFHPDALPPQDDKEIVFMCAGGVRSIKAIELTRAYGREVSAHLAPGIRGWLMQGLPVISA